MRDPLEQTKPSAAEKRDDLLLWTALLANPLAMGVNTVVGFTVAHWTSDTGRRHFSYLVSGMDILICAGALLIATRVHRKFSEAEDDVPMDGRRRFMAVLGILISVLTAVLILAQTLALVTVHPYD